MKNSLTTKYSNFIKNINNKKIFLIQVYATLIFQIWIAYIVLMYSENHNFIQNKYTFIYCIIALFIIIITISIITSPILKFILFCLFSGIVGLILSYRLDLENEKDLELAKKALKTTAIIFVFIVLFGYFLAFMGVSISPIVGIILFFLLLILIIVIFILYLTNTYKLYHKIIAGIIIFLFSIFILFDTMKILDKNYNDNFVSASVDYFLDFLNIFSGFISLNN